MVDKPGGSGAKSGLIHLWVVAKVINHFLGGMILEVLLNILGMIKITIPNEIPIFSSRFIGNLGDNYGKNRR